MDMVHDMDSICEHSVGSAMHTFIPEQLSFPVVELISQLGMEGS